MNRTPISTPQAPAAVGPYSQGVRAGGWLFTAGQIPLDPATGLIVAGGVEEQAERVLRNLQAVLEAGGASPRAVVKTTMFLTDLADFEKVNAVYARWFPAESAPPARTTIQVVALPRGARVEIEAVAWVG